MDRLPLLLYLIFCTHSVLSFCPNETASQEKSWEGKLLSEIHDNYTAYLLSYCESHLETVSITFYVKYISVNGSENELIIESKVNSSWIDDQIQWSPDNFGGLHHVKTDSIYKYMWVPHFLVMNSNSVWANRHGPKLNTQCKVYNNGEVNCIQKISHKGSCKSDLTKWPYDKLDCTIVTGTRDYTSGLNLTFSSDDGGVDISNAYIADGWSVQDTSFDKNKNFLFIYITLERRAQDLEVLILTPILITVTFVILSLFLNVDSNLRLLIVCFCIYLHQEVISTITKMMPKHSRFIPKILTFLFISVGINCVLMFISLILGRVIAKEYPVPIWMETINNAILESKAKYIVITSWRPKLSEEDSKYKFAKDWVDFANIFNAILGLIVIFIYFCILFALIPWPQSVHGKTKYYLM